MIRRNGPGPWTNVHHTVETNLHDLIDVYNPGPTIEAGMTGLEILHQAAENLGRLVRDARKAGQRMRAAGAGWALSDIAISDGWLLNTANLNGCFNVTEKYRHPQYSAKKLKYLVVSQCGKSMGELNAYLEATTANRRALKTSGIGNGQSVAGAISGSTHGAAIRFGSTPDFVVGIHLVTGRRKSLWLERASYPVMNDQFVADLEAEAFRDDDVFAAAQVSFGAFGIIAAVAIETDPIYHLEFPKAGEVNQNQLATELAHLATVKNNDETAPYHYEFIFNPYRKSMILVAAAKRIAFSGDKPPPEPPRWQIGGNGLAPGNHLPAAVLRLPIPRLITNFQWKWYRQNALLENCLGTPGQVFSATISYFEGTVESAFAVSITDTIRVMDISSDIVKDLMVPSICQARVVHPTASMLGFTNHGPKTVIFEFAMANDSKFPKFENALREEFTKQGIPYTFHWSKNSGLDKGEIVKMYGADRVSKWRKARDTVFGNSGSLKAVFDNPQLVRGGLS
jgi:FAD binding domain